MSHGQVFDYRIVSIAAAIIPSGLFHGFGKSWCCGVQLSAPSIIPERRLSHLRTLLVAGNLCGLLCNVSNDLD